MTNRAFGCAIGTMSEPAGTSSRSSFHTPSSFVVKWPSNGAVPNVTLVARKASTFAPCDAREALELDAVDREPLTEPRSVRRRHDVRAARRANGDLRHERVPERNAPHLRLRRIVTSHQRTGDRRRLARVRITAKVDHRDVRAGVEVERDFLAAELFGARVGFPRELAPVAALLRHHLGELHEDVVSDAHARRIVLPRVRLDEQRITIASRPVAGREARRIRARIEARHADRRSRGTTDRSRRAANLARSAPRSAP